MVGEVDLRDSWIGDMEKRQERELTFNVKHVLGTVLSSFANIRHNSPQY